jgi:Fic family protein
MKSSDFSLECPGSLNQTTDALGRKGLAFVPSALPPATLDFGDREIRLALSTADQALARLDGMARQIDRPDLLFASYVRREALLSSAIEGTHATLADLVLFEATQVKRHIDDVHVSNYVTAFNYGRSRVRDIPIGRTLFNELHAILMDASDHEKTLPGKIRDRLVFIGTPTFEAARFVPPAEYFVPELLENLEDYLNTENEAPLIKLALAHYQFEAIHPYCDGNGRLGRLMISLWLHRERVLTSPMLYLSAYFERHRDEYYNTLLRVRTVGAWKEWVIFFLRGVAHQSRDAARRIEVLIHLRNKYRIRVAGTRVSHGVLRLIDELFLIPVITVPQAEKILSVTTKPARASIERLVKVGILSTKRRFGTTMFYFADELLRLTNIPLDDDTIPDEDI